MRHTHVASYVCCIVHMHHTYSVTYRWYIIHMYHTYVASYICIIHNISLLGGHSPHIPPQDFFLHALLTCLLGGAFAPPPYAPMLLFSCIHYCIRPPRAQNVSFVVSYMYCTIPICCVIHAMCRTYVVLNMCCFVHIFDHTYLS